MGCEAVIWPGAYSDGSSLQAPAYNHHCYIVTSTATPDGPFYDITGEQILYQLARDLNLSRVRLDLDGAVYHQNFNLEKRDNLHKERCQDLAEEKSMGLEQWFVLKAVRLGVSARASARQ